MKATSGVTLGNFIFICSHGSSSQGECAVLSPETALRVIYDTVRMLDLENPFKSQTLLCFNEETKVVI